jgi:hypothetical protein
VVNEKKKLLHEQQPCNFKNFREFGQRVVEEYNNTHTCSSGRTTVSCGQLCGKAVETFLKSQSLAAKPPTKTTC